MINNNMKKTNLTKVIQTFLSVLFLLAVGIALAAQPTEIQLTGGNPAVPAQITTNDYRARTIVFVGNKAARTPNSGTVWIQVNSTNDSPGIKLLSGQTISLTAGAAGFDLRAFYVDVETTNDGCAVLMLQ